MLNIKVDSIYNIQGNLFCDKIERNNVPTGNYIRLLGVRYM